MKLRTKTIAKAGTVSAFAAGMVMLLAPAASAVTSAPAQFTPTSGGSATPFSVTANNLTGVCTGSSLNGYFVTGYVARANPTTLTWDSAGPTDPAGGVAFPLIDSGHLPYVERPTSDPNAAGQGSVLPTGPLTWTDFTINDLPAGTYHAGLACTLTAAGVRTLDNFFDVIFTVTAAPADPGGFVWAVTPNPDVPEVPLAALLPLTAVGMAGVFALVHYRRRRHSQDALAV
jgi:hypothetical protein